MKRASSGKKINRAKGLGLDLSYSSGEKGWLDKMEFFFWGVRRALRV